VEALRAASFTSSVVTTLDSWRVFVKRQPEPVHLLSEDELGRLTPAERLAYDDERGDYHAELPALKTPILDRTVTKGLLFMRLNRGQQTGTPCGMILSGVPGVGKTTAVKALGRTVEQTYRARNPQMADAVPVVYITMPTARHPKALPAELLYFLGAPHTARATETTLTHQACQLMTDFKTSLVIVDEVHEIDRSHASHDQQSDQLKYFMDHVPATFVLAGINVENCGFFTGHRGHQLARRFTTLKASPSNYSTIPQRQEWARLIDGFERALRLHAHKPGSLLPLADYLYGRTGGYIVSLSHLIRAAAIQAILTGVERIDEEVLNSVDLDHAATEKAASQREAARKSRKRGKK
jgi:DNA polymerase III delta prime subunit